MSSAETHEQQGVSVSATFDATVSLATLQNFVRAVKAIVIENHTAETLRDVVVTLDAEPGFALSTQSRVAAIGPGQRYEVTDLDLVLSPDFLLSASERTRGLVHVRVMHGNDELAAERLDIDVLAYDDWSGARSLPELIAAFVLPNHPVVEQMLGDAATLLRAAGHSSALDGYQRESRQAVMHIVSGIYESVRRHGLRYVNPPASFEEVGQKIRTPDRVMASRLGTCLDLSVLFAACLEQAGLHPVVVFLEGHAFVGAWLEERTFATPTLDDGIDVRKRVDGHQMVVFETTLVTSDTAVPFDKAVSTARRSLDDASKFRFAVDVARARKAQIRPIHGRVSEAGVFEPLTRHKEPEQTPGLPIAPVVPEAQAVDPDALALAQRETRLDRWKRKLLDLSLNNRLLNFKSSKKTVRLLCPDPAAFEDGLAGGKRFKVIGEPNELEGSDPRDAATFRRKTGDDVVEHVLKEAVGAGRVHANLSEAELDVRLTQIYRDARLALEESGTSALYCAIGMLNWFPNGASDQVRCAPLLLVPVELSRASIQSGFRLELGSDEPRVNVTLLQMLMQDHELVVPGLDPLPTDEHGIDVPKVLDIFREAVSGMPRWEVREEVHLGFFSFSKFLMWRDLQEHEEDVLSNGVVRHLVEKRNEEFDPGAPIPVPERLDVEYAPQQTYCPLSADSSQLQAVFAAQAGGSFVLKGPPGTGKSQTITNIIAQCLAQSKTVLFVAEKNVALNVVHSRLEHVGLGDFCLELHSSKARKADVVQQLERAMNRNRPKAPVQWDSDGASLGNLRAQLNQYVEALHKPRNTGSSVYHGLAQSLALASRAPLVALSWPTGSVDKSRRDTLLERVRRLATVGEQCGDVRAHPWRAVRRTEWTPAWKDEVEQAALRLERLSRSMAEQLAPALSMLGRPSDGETLAGLRASVQAGAALVDCPHVPESLLVHGDWGAVREDAEALVLHGRQRDSLRAVVFAPFTDHVLSIDLDGLVERLRRRTEAFPLLRWLSRGLVRWSLRRVIRPGARIALETLQGLLEKARELRGEEKTVSQAGNRLASVIGRYWNDGNGDWERIEQAVNAASRLRSSAATIAPDNPDSSVAMRRRWASLISERSDDLRSDGVLGRQLLSARDGLRSLESAIQDFEITLGVKVEDMGLALDTPHALAKLAEVAHRACANVTQLRAWCQWQRAREEAVADGLGPLVEAFEAGTIGSSALEAAFHRSFYHWWLRDVFAAEPLLTQFNSADHARKIQSFRGADDTHRSLTSSAVRAILSARAPVVTSATADASGLGIIRRETQKKRRHKSVRALLSETGDVVMRLTPCFLMSPISVAQYLAPGMPKFDVVIFDEASQIPVWDSVGAMARGKSTIIVGDPKQLPPTNFFGRSDDEGQGGDDDLEDLESILDDCLGAGVPELQLRWHYRSQHESLIAFSNRHYYDNQLLTFPSADTDAGNGRGVSMRYVADGVYDKGKSRTNRVEAEAVVSEIVRRLKDPSASHSIGVVTFNSDQMRLIEDLLDAARRTEPELDVAFDEDDSDRIMVKNLESIQGDERDVIFFSIGFGRDLHGKTSMNFGPMNRDGGQRRLNVAITRARKEVIVFSSLRADDIDLSRTNARGVADLKSFLAYAERGYKAIAEVVTFDDGADFDSPFEREVCARLRELGWTVHLQVGCSGYRIDLAVVDPDAPGRYLLGVECDGATYHRAATARDRDKLREAVLRGLGWDLHRIWSTDWWNDRETEARRLHEKLEDTLAQKRAARDAEDLSQEIPLEPLYSEAPAAPPPVPSSVPPSLPAPAASSYVSVDAKTLGGPDDFYENTATGLVRDAITKTVAVEGPISLALLSRRVGAMWGFARVTSRARARIEKLCDVIGLRRTEHGGDIFLWSESTDPSCYELFRIADNDNGLRSAEDLPPEEVANAAKAVLKANISIPADDLAKETARLLGFQRIGTRVRKRIDAGVAILCARGDASSENDIVTLAG